MKQNLLNLLSDICTDIVPDILLAFGCTLSVVILIAIGRGIYLSV